MKNSKGVNNHNNNNNDLPKNASSKSGYRTSLRHDKYWWKKINPTKIGLQNNHSKIKEIFKHYNKFYATASKSTREATQKNSINKENNKFANQLDLIPKEAKIKDEASEAAKKNIKKGTKT